MSGQWPERPLPAPNEPWHRDERESSEISSDYSGPSPEGPHTRRRIGDRVDVIYQKTVARDGVRFLERSSSLSVPLALTKPLNTLLLSDTRFVRTIPEASAWFFSTVPRSKNQSFKIINGPIERKFRGLSPQRFNLWRIGKHATYCVRQCNGVAHRYQWPNTTLVQDLGRAGRTIGTDARTPACECFNQYVTQTFPLGRKNERGCSAHERKRIVDPPLGATPSLEAPTRTPVSPVLLDTDLRPG